MRECSRVFPRWLFARQFNIISPQQSPYSFPSLIQGEKRKCLRSDSSQSAPKWTQNSLPFHFQQTFPAISACRGSGDEHRNTPTPQRITNSFWMFSLTAICDHHRNSVSMADINKSFTIVKFCWFSATPLQPIYKFSVSSCADCMAAPSCVFIYVEDNCI